ncbi:acyltransferase family protein [Brevifollis gellanilyticus]|uniref:O-antigen acetylase n=1 Tax=Brevifollis gellanilyticus TaxID=748831 RepID=A0A512MER0_9BACT|nr:acyltransferase family protein [Brevifollis gellanilyticus]GEP45188.1 O-antigen acetylase [Brevifollis gellanilyticus]
MPWTPPSTAYQPAIDGLRAVAVLMVVLFHAGLGFSGGFVGVDVFFVISGCLITRLILRDLAQGTFSLAAFWERRARRIMPALVVTVMICLLAGAWLYLPTDFMALGRAALAQALLVSNIHFYREIDYFDTASEVNPLLHTWSLAVEEQFYLLFPFLLLMLRKISKQPWLVLITLSALLSLAVSHFLGMPRPSANFYLLPTRAWELLLGALVAVAPSSLPRRASAEIAGWLGLLAIIASGLLYTRATPFPGLAALPPCLGAAMMIWAQSNAASTPARILSSRPFVWIGLISYSLYLWHWPLLAFSGYWRAEPMSAGMRWLIVVISIVVAAVSWRWVEQPFRHRTLCASRRRIFAFAALSLLITGISGFIVQRLQGLPARISPEVLRYAKGSTDAAFRTELRLSQAQAGDLPSLGIKDTSKPIDLLLWGDSHAMAVAPVIDLLCREHGWRAAQATRSALLPLLGEALPSDASSVSQNEAILNRIRTLRIPRVLLVGRWDIHLGKPGAMESLRQHLHDTLRDLQQSGTQVWIMRQVPRPGWNVPRGLAAAVRWGTQDPQEMSIPLTQHQKDFQRQEPLFADLDKLFPNLQVLDPTPLFLNESKTACLTSKDGLSWYSDDDHLSITGSMQMKTLFESLFGKK